MSLNQVFNATEEIADADNYPDMRILDTGYCATDAPSDDCY